MARILFVTGSAGGVGVGNLQHRGALRKSNGGSRNVLNISSARSVKVIAAPIWRNFVPGLSYDITVHAPPASCVDGARKPQLVRVHAVAVSTRSVARGKCAPR